MRLTRSSKLDYFVVHITLHRDMSFLLYMSASSETYRHVRVPTLYE